jgi:hypothetical protein
MYRRCRFADVCGFWTPLVECWDGLRLQHQVRSDIAEAIQKNRHYVIARGLEAPQILAVLRKFRRPMIVTLSVPVMAQFGFSRFR